MEKIDHSQLSGRLLELFIAIYDSSSVSAAASQFDLTQSTVSHSLAKLRACIGDPLFVKSGRGIVPTERASMLVPRIRAILADLEGLAETDIYAPGTDFRPITIAANVLEVMPMCLSLRRKIMEHAPYAPLRLLELGSRDNIETLLETRQVDLVVSVRPQQLAAALNSWLPPSVNHVLDLCSGSGCLGILAAHLFPQATVTLVELDHAALQCGICTPGFLVAAKALLDHNPDPTETEVRYWLAGNLCRCTGYDKIVRAVMDTAAEMRGA